MATISWKSPVTGSWTSAANWDLGTVPGSGDVVRINVVAPNSATSTFATPYTVSLSTPITVSSITIGADSATLDIESIEGTAAITSALINAGTVNLDTNTSGGSSLTVGSTLTNTGTVSIGDTFLSTATNASVTGLNNAIGAAIEITGNTFSAVRATLNVNHTAGFGTAGIVTGGVTLSGDALIDFSTGGISSIAADSSLTLLNRNSFVAVGSTTTSNSALTSLASNAGTLSLQNAAVISTTSGLAFSNTGTVDIDTQTEFNTLPASTVKFGGTFTNTGDLEIGNTTLGASVTVTAAGLINAPNGDIEITGNTSSAVRAVLNVSGAAGFGTAGTLTGAVDLSGNALLEFASGGITSIANDASLSLESHNSFLALSSATTSNSALTGLKSNAGTLNLSGGATLATKSGVSLTNTGLIEVDGGFSFYAGTGSSFKVGGTLINEGSLVVGNTGLSSPVTVTATGLVNTDSGSIRLTGNSSSPVAALLDITGAAGFGTAGTLTGQVTLSNDALLEFASGGITAIDDGALLSLNGSNSFVALSSGTTTNSALTGLKTNAGTLSLSDDAALTTKSGVTLTNSGIIRVDAGFYGAGQFGGSALKIGSTLVNSGTISIGSQGIGQAVTASATGLVNTASGRIQLTGGSLSPVLTTLSISGAAGFGTAGTVTGLVSLSGDALLQFGSGTITTIGQGALLDLSGKDARVAITGSTTSNSALTGLKTVAGTFDLEDGAVVTTSTSLVNTGTVGVDAFSTGGSLLTVGGAITNSGTFGVSGFVNGEASATATRLTNTGSFQLSGLAKMTVGSTVANSGSISIGSSAALTVTGAGVFTQTAGLTTVAGALSALHVTVAGGVLDFTSDVGAASDTGTVTITSTGFVEYDAAVASGQTVVFSTSTGTVELDAPALFAGTIKGFATGDLIDLINTPVTKLTYSGTSTSGTLTVADGSVTVATLKFSGNFTTASFAFESDGNGGGGTIVKLAPSTSTTTFEWTKSSGGSFTTASNWSQSAVPGSTDDAVIGLPGSYTVSLTAAATVHSLTVQNPGATLAIVAPAHSDKISGNLVNDGTLAVDTTGTTVGGTTVAVGGTLINSGKIQIGTSSDSLAKATTVAAKALANTGVIEVFGGKTTTAKATLDINSAAPATLTGSILLFDNALLEYTSGSVATIADGSALLLSGNGSGSAEQPHVATSSSTTTNSALTGLATNFGTFGLLGGETVTVSGTLTNAGALSVDSPLSIFDSNFNSSFVGGSGGSSLTVGTLVNTGSLSIGNSSISHTSTVTVTTLVNNAGSVNLTGGAGATAILNVKSAAPSTLVGNFNLSGRSLLEFASGEITAIAAGSGLSLSGAGAGSSAQPHVAHSSNTSSNGALIDLSNNAGSLNLSGGVTLALTTSLGLTNTGSVFVDFNGTGGSTLSIAGTLSNDGSLDIGSNDIAHATTVTAKGLGDIGSIDITGGFSGGAATLATLHISGAAPSTLTGNVTLSGNALLEFASGGITTIGAGGGLSLLGTGAGHATQPLVAIASSLTTNSALTALRSNLGTLELESGIVLKTTGSLTNSGNLDIDEANGGGSRVTIGGVLNNQDGTIIIGSPTEGLASSTTVTATGFVNSGALTIGGGGATAQAVLDITAAAPTTLTGFNTLLGNAVLEFASGAITAIGNDAVLSMTGSGIGGEAPRIADASNTATSSALTTLASNAGRLSLASGASLSTTVAFTNTETVLVDSVSGAGGSSLTIGGKLTNQGSLQIGPSDGNLAGSATVTATGLANSGTIDLNGGVHGGQAILNITGAAPTTLGGTIALSNNALLQFASGGISTIANNGTLTLLGDGVGRPQPSVADKGGAANSALAGLSVNGGTLDLEFGASLTTNTDFVNTGNIELATDPGSSGDVLAIGGVLTNEFGIQIGDQGAGLAGATTITAAGLINTGNINLYGGLGSNKAVFDITASAPQPLLVGNIRLFDNALLEFANGSFTGIAANSSLLLSGTGAGSSVQPRVAILGHITSNSALTALASNAGTLDQEFGEAITTTTDFQNLGALLLDTQNNAAGSSLTIGGVLSNIDNNPSSFGQTNGFIELGPTNGSLAATTTLTADGLDNGESATIQLNGGAGSADALLVINGSAANAGTITIGGGAELEVTGGNTYVQTEGTTAVTGTLSATALSFTGGFVEGSGKIVGNVDNSGALFEPATTVNFSTQPAKLTITGAYAQSGSGELELLVQGTATGQFSSLTATTLALSGGTLDIQTLSGFTPAAGQSLAILHFTAGTMPGLFGALEYNGFVGGATYVDIGGLTAGLDYNLAAGTISLDFITTPASHADAWKTGTGHWSTAGDWTAGVPSFASDVTIDQAAGKVTLDKTGSVDSLDIGNANSLTYNASETLSVGNGLIVETGGTLTMTAASDKLQIGGSSSIGGKIAIGSGDTLGVFGVLDISGVMTLSNSTLAGDGGVTIVSGGTLSGSGTIGSGLYLENLGRLALSGTFVDNGTLVNRATLSGALTVGAGGYLSNAAGHSITFAGTAVTGAASTSAGTRIVNLGTISGTGSSGIGIAFTGTAGNTLANTGKISGAGGTAVAFGAGSDTLMLYAGFSFTGKVDAGGGTNTLELAGPNPGSLTGLGTTITNFDRIAVDAGASWTLTGSNTIAAGVSLQNSGFLTDAGALTNAGSINATITLASGGSLTNSTTGTISGSGPAVYSAAAGVSVVNHHVFKSTASAGVDLAGGGSVTNGSTSLTTTTIAGYSYGVEVYGTTSSVTNFASLTSSNGVAIRTEGTVINGVSGKTIGFVQGYQAGIALYGPGGVITNFGSVKATSAIGNGIYLGTAGSLKNLGTVSATGVNGSAVGGSGGVVSNYGHLLASGTAGSAVLLSGTGTIINHTGGVIQGTAAGIYLTGTAWSISNSGTITGKIGINATYDTGDITITNHAKIASSSGTGGVALVLGSGDDQLTIASGSVITGSIKGGAGSNTIDFTVAGTDDIAHVTGFGTIDLAASGASTVTLTSTNFSQVAGNVITVNGGGSGDKINASAVSAAHGVVIKGGSGADTITVGQSATMTGGSGDDLFVFTTQGTSGTPNTNTITDFAHAADEIVFSSSGFGLGETSPTSTPKALPSSQFVSNSSGTFTNTTQRFAYDTTSGDLFFAAKGNAAGSTRLLVTHITGHPTVSATDLFYIT